MLKISLLSFISLWHLACSESKFSMGGRAASSDQKLEKNEDITPISSKDGIDGSSDSNKKVIVVNSESQLFIDSGTKTKLVGVGYAAGNFDDWNDGAICFDTTDADISVINHKIFANKDVELNVKLFADMLPLPTLEVYKVIDNGDQILLVSKTLNRAQRHEKKISLKQGEFLYTKMVLNGSTAYEQSSTTYTRVTINHCDDYADK
jgi:hypothetical protein